MSTSYDFKCVTCNVTEDIEAGNPLHLINAYQNAERLIQAQEILDTEGVTEHGGLSHAAMRFLQRHRGHVIVIISEYGTVIPVAVRRDPVNPRLCIHDWRYDNLWGRTRQCRKCAVVQRTVWQDLPAKEEEEC